MRRPGLSGVPAGGLIATLAVLALAVPCARAQAPDPPPADQALIYHGEATSILGRTVRDPGGDSVGRIIDILVDDAGQPRAAVIEFGGFMGVGNRRVAVTWRALHFATAEGHGAISLDMTTDQIKDTPDFRRPLNPADPPVSVAVPPGPK